MKASAIPLRLRLASWYLLILFFSLAVCYAVTFLGIRRAVEETLDGQLRLRSDRLQALLETQLSSNPVSSGPLKQPVSVDEAYRISSPDGTILYQSELMGSLSVPSDFLHMTHHYRHYRDLNGYTTYYHRQGDVRVLASILQIGAVQYRLQVASVVSPFYSTLRLFGRAAAISILFILIVAGCGGYWLSGRSLEPLRELIQDTHAITDRNLGTRLIVPCAKDELQELALTINDMLARLETAFTSVRQFTSDASHELRTPIAVIRSTTELLLARERSLADQQTLLHRILAEAEASSSLIEQLLTIARADNELKIPLVPIDLCDVVLDVEAVARVLAEEAHVTLKFAVPEVATVVLGSASYIRRLLLILLENACHYTAPGGWIGLSLRRSNSHAILSVTDSGIGIPAADQDRICDRFFRASNARSFHPSGNGLGLAIAFWIAEVHSSSLEIESKEGSGTCVSFRVPVSLANP